MKIHSFFNKVLKTMTIGVAFMSLPLHAQRVRNIDLAGVINIYASVTAISGNVVTVASGSGFQKGDKVLLIQMKGATIDESQAENYGNVTAYNNAGNYEFAEITNAAANKITLNKISRSYTPGAGVQLVKVPVYNDPVNISGVLTCAPWDGVSGGVLVLEVNNTLTFSSNVDVNGKGFRGGSFSRSDYGCILDSYGSSSYKVGGQKGEGIPGSSSAQLYGIGKNGNGGGGGNRGNSGGGGGSNAALAGMGGNQSSGCIPLHGQGGVPLDYTQLKLFLGGGGGGGFADNGGPVTPGTNGGGLVIITANLIASNGRNILSNGLNQSLLASDESAGGGGSGGTVYLNVPIIEGTLNILTRGGNGGSTFNNMFINDCHGPGGGGSGGAIITPYNTLPGNIAFDLGSGDAGLVKNPLSPCFNTTDGASAGSVGTVFSRTEDPYLPKGSGTTTSNPSNFWSITGNSNIASNNFLGTMNSSPLVFKTNNVAAMTILANKNVGIGISSPTTLLDLKRDGGTGGRNVMLKLTNNYNTASSALNEPTILFDNGTSASVYGSYGWTLGAQVAGASYFRIGKYSGITFSEYFRINDNGNVGIGTEYIPADFRLAVNGKIICTEVAVKLRTRWPDYVFGENYNLITLDSVSSYIAENKHLPGVPSAQEVKDKEVELGEMGAILLKKVEELTLYTLEQQKLILLQIEANEKQMKIIQEQEERIKELEESHE